MTSSEIPRQLQLGSRNGVGHMKTNGLSEIGFDREKMPSEPPQPAMAKESRARVKSSSQANFHPYGWRMQGFPYSSGWTRQERRGEYENTCLLGNWLCSYENCRANRPNGHSRER